MEETAREFQVQIRLSSINGFPFIALAGECDAFSAPMTHGAVRGLIEAGHKGIIIDLTDLTYIDVAGFHALDDCCITIGEAGGEILLVNPRVHIEEIYKLLREKESCKIMHTLEEALDRLRATQSD